LERTTFWFSGEQSSDLLAKVKEIKLQDLLLTAGLNTRASTKKDLQSENSDE